MFKTAAVTGGIGDIVYSIPIMRKLEIKLLYVKENFYPKPYGSMYTAVKSLLASQGIECLPIEGGTPFNVFPDDCKPDYNLDAWRVRPGRDSVHIIQNMMFHFRCYDANWNAPFLRGFDNFVEHPFNLVFLTDRWRENSKVDWKAVRSRLQNEGNPFYFIGLPEDHDNFVKNYGEITRMPTQDLLLMAKLIAQCKALYCNQGVALTIAQGLGKKYFLEVKPTKTNTLFRTKNENILR